MNVRGGNWLILEFQSNFISLGNVQENQFYLTLFACRFPKFYAFILSWKASLKSITYLKNENRNLKFEVSEYVTSDK